MGAEVEWSLPLDKLELSTRKGCITITYKQVAESARVIVRKVKDDYKKSKGYFELLAKAGPGSLLELGQDVTRL